jgi:hypothetical protein
VTIYAHDTEYCSSILLLLFSPLIGDSYSLRRFIDPCGELCSKQFHGLIIEVYLQKLHNNTTNTIHHRELHTNHPTPPPEPLSRYSLAIGRIILNEIDVGLQHLKKMLVQIAG